MTSPDVPAADAAEQRSSPTGDEPVGTTPDVGLEADEADVLEQGRSAGPGEHQAARELPLEADAADSAEQAVVVPLDEDEGRDAR
jgi:hypothetical protein